MAFTKVLIAGSAFFAVALAQGVAFTEWPTSVTAGQPTTLKWTGDGGAPVTLTLRKGPSTALNDVEVISPDATNGEYTWTPSTDLENASDYAFQISQGDQINYSGLVSLGGGSDTPPPAPASAAAASASGPQSDTAAAVPSDTATLASAAQGMTSAADRAMTTAAPPTDSAPASAPASASPSDTAASATTTSGPSGTDMSSESSAEATETSTPTVVARPSLMNTPFNAANDDASETSTGSSSVQTGAAGRVAVPVALGVVSSALLWFFQ